MIRKYFVISLLLFAISTSGVFADNLYKIHAKDMGFRSLDYTAVEIERKTRLSVLRIPGFHSRTAAASRWMMCVYTDIAQKRGFQYWAVAYPAPPSEDVLVGFPDLQEEKIAQTIGPKFGTTNVLPTMPVSKMIVFCNELKRRQ